MNQVQDRKALVEFLEDALAQAEVAQTPRCTQEKLDQELKQALLEYEQALTQEQPGTKGLSQSMARPESAEAARPAVRLLAPREVWHRALLGNVRAVLGITAPDYSQISAQPVASDLLIEPAPWYRSISSQLQDLWTSQRVSPLLITARPVEIQELFHEYPLRSSSMAWPGLFHLLALCLLLYVPLHTLEPLQNPRRIQPEVSILISEKPSLHLPPKAAKPGGGGGGGRRESRPASLGRLPRASDRQLKPPVPEIKNLHPVLPVEPTLVASDLSQLPVINLPNYGEAKQRRKASPLGSWRPFGGRFCD